MEESSDIDAYAVNEELKSLKIKYKQLDLKVKEKDIAVNKNLSELKSLRNLVKLWLESSKNVSKDAYKTKIQFDMAIDQITNKCNETITIAEEKIQNNLLLIDKIKKIIINQKITIKSQNTNIDSKDEKIEVLEKDLNEALGNLNYYINNNEAEVQKLCTPMRDKITDTMFMLMKEKVLIYYCMHVFPYSLMDDCIYSFKYIEKRYIDN